MVLTPFATQTAEPIYRFYRRHFRHIPLSTVQLSYDGLQDHVVITGGGRVGHRVARVLKQLGLAFVIVELDQQRVDQAKAAGMPVIYGDASQLHILEAAAIDKARLLIITTPAPAVTRTIIQQMRQAYPRLHVVVRATDLEEVRALHRLGVYEVVQPEVEASLEVVRQALLHLEMPPAEVQRYTNQVRQEFYTP